MTTDNSPSPRSAGSEQQRPIVALAWPTGRAIYPYTVEEIAAGVDLYTRRLKAGTVAEPGDSHAA